MAEASHPSIERNLSSLIDSLAFLADASQALGASLNYQTVLERLANLVVPSLADWCAVDVIDDNGRPQRVAVAQSEPAGRRLGERMSAMRLEALPAGSAIAVPLVTRGRTIGVMTLVTDPERRTYGATERSLAEDLASRAALAVENARLFAERSRVARALQQSLLPPQLPQIPGVEVAARYHAAGEGIDVGGDFYDLFRTAKDDWAILVGDVCGKGADAAALTALARYTVRAAAMQARRPSRVLTTLNDALLAEASRRASPDERFCTVAYTRLRPVAKGIRITTASGGHPQPLVVSADGRVELACASGN